MRAHDRVRESTTTTGLGNFVLGGAAASYVAFGDRYANGERFRYSCVGANEWETGKGRYDASADEIVREECIESSNADAFVNFTDAAKFVWVDHPAQMDNDTGQVLALARNFFMK